MGFLHSTNCLGVFNGSDMRFDVTDKEQGLFCYPLGKPEEKQRIEVYPPNNTNKTLSFVMPADVRGEIAVVLRTCLMGNKRDIKESLPFSLKPVAQD